MTERLRCWVAAAQEPSVTLIRLVVPVTPCSLSDDSCQDEDQATQVAVRFAALRLSAALRALQPGGPSVCWPASTNQQVTVVVSGKANAAAGYKALATNAAKLGYKLADVKSTVVVAPMQYDDLQRTAEAALSQALRTQGWHRIGSMWARCDVLAAAPGRSNIVPATQLLVEPATATTATLALGFKHAGLYKFQPFWPLPLPPSPAGAATAETIATETADMAAMKAEEEARGAALAALFSDRVALRRAVARLSDTRVMVVGPGVPAYVVGLKPLPTTPSAVQHLRDKWLGHFGLELPPALGGFIAEVAGSPEADPDEAKEVPGCCVWVAASGACGHVAGDGDGAAEGGIGRELAGGLVPVPPGKCTMSGEEVARQLMEDLARAASTKFTFWGSGGLSPRSEAPVGAEAALEKRRAGTAQTAVPATATAAAKAPTAAAAANLPKVMAGGGWTSAGALASAEVAAAATENTGWTAAVEVIVSGFRAHVSLGPATQVLRRTIDPDLDGGGGGAGGGEGARGFVSAAAAEAAEAAYGDERERSGDAAGSAAAREAMLQRSSDEALRAAAERRAAARVVERDFWEKYRVFRESRKEEDQEGEPQKQPASGQAAVGLRPPRSLTFGTSGRTTGVLGKAAASAARPQLKAPAAGKKPPVAMGGSKATKAAGAAAKPAGPAAAKTAGVTKAKAVGKAAKPAAFTADGLEGGVGRGEGGAPVPAATGQKRAAGKAAAGADGGAPAKKKAKAAPAAAATAAATAAPAAATAAATAAPAAATATGTLVTAGPGDITTPVVGLAGEPPPVAVDVVAPGAGAATAIADGAATIAIAADLYDNDADEFVNAAAAAAVPAAVTVAKKAKSAKAAGAGGKRPGPPLVADQAGCSTMAPTATAVVAGPADADAAAGAAAAGVAAGAEAAAPAGAGKESRKRTKASDLDLAVVEAKVSAAAAAGRLGDLTLPEMQCWLRARKAPVSGKKADVETRLASLLGLSAPTSAPAAAAVAVS